MSNQFVYLESDPPVETYNGVDIYFNGKSYYAMAYNGETQKSVEIVMTEKYDVKVGIDTYMAEAYYIALKDICVNFGVDPDVLHLYNGEEVVSVIKEKLKMEFQSTLDNLVIV